MQDNPFFKVLTQTAKKQLEKLGYDVIIADAKQDIMRQSTDIDNFIAARVKAIILTPVDAFALAPAVNRADKAGVPVICADMTVYNCKLTSTVESDNYNAGFVVGEYLVKYFTDEQEKGKKAPLELAIGTYNQANSCIARVRGLKDALNSAPKGLVKIVDEHECGANYEAGLRIAQDWITSFPKLAAIFMINDPAGIGAVRAVEQTAKGRSIIVTSVDGNPDAVIEISKGGAYKCTGSQYPQVMGYVAANMIADVLAGRQVPTYVKTKTGAIAMPVKGQPWEADVSNLDELITKTIDVTYPITKPVD